MVKNLPVDAGDAGLIPGLGRSPGEGNDNSLQDACPEDPMDRGAWWATVSGVVRVGHNLGTKQHNIMKSLHPQTWYAFPLIPFNIDS